MDPVEDVAMTSEEDVEEDMQDSYSGDQVGVEKDITKDGGVKKVIMTAGAGWETPEKGDEVYVHYVGTLEDGTEFDSSLDRNEPFSFKLGEGSVIKGWDEGVKTMKKGEKAVLTCQPEYAYGKAGSPPKIPANATLKFEVELLRWRSVKDISGDGGVVKTILQEGDGWQKPGNRCEVLVKYWLKVQGQDEPFERTPEDGVEFATSAAPLKGLATALKQMRKGEKAHLVLKPEYAYEDEGKPPVVPAGATVEAEVELVSWKTVENVTDDGAIWKKILKASDGWKRAKAGSKITVDYVGRTVDGTILEQHSGRELVTDEEIVFEGLDLALQQMKMDEEAEVHISPPYTPPIAPAMASVIYNVKITSIVEPKEKWDMNEAEKADTAAALKAKGNKAWKEGKVPRALKQWKLAVEHVENNEKWEAELRTKSNELRKACQLNLAAGHTKAKEYQEAVKACSKVLAADSSNVKALYRRAQAYMGTQDFVEAEQDIKAALLVSPNDKDVRVLYKKFRQEMAAQNKKDAALYSSMFAKLRRMTEQEDKLQSKAPVPQDTDMTPADTPAPMEAGPSTVEASA